ncbi:MAG: hypothetical protein QOH06_5816 [Acidobacteriota bacterium]|jgi:uncharacterized protein (DUF1800 family)|nr:hypothetical protein [Acidobacteriota bacterium]
MTVTGCRAAGWLLLLGLGGFLGNAPLEAAGTDFYSLTPCRLVDTRGVAGPFGGPNLATQEARGFGAAGRCGVSTMAEAVAVNVTVVPLAAGHLAFTGTGSPTPTTSTINFQAGKTRANNAVLPLGAGGGLTVFAFSPAEVAVIVDVTGYFADGALAATTTARPAFGPPPGTYNGGRTVDIVTSTPGAQIRYTTDGSAPSRTHGTVYAGPLALAANTNLRAIAYKDGLADSTVTQGNYTIVRQDALYIATMTPQSGTLSLGSGNATLLLAADEQTAVLRFTWSNLSANLTGSHIHAPDGSIIFDIDDEVPEADGSRVWVLAPAGAWTKQQILDALRAGQCYINLHTANYPSGEIKGFFRRANGSTTFTPPPPPPPLPPGLPTAAAASRFLAQATFGPTQEAIAAVQAQGYDAWITAQFAQPVVSHLGYLDALPPPDDGDEYPNWIARESIWKQAIQGPDQLRQRVAFALSEIVVVSSEDSDLFEAEPISAYMDLLNQNAFGNFRLLLQGVTLSPSMGVYLDMLSNDKEDPETGQNPNENYAREVLQLFSIGLYKLHPDGTLQLGEWGLPIETYDQNVIKGFAQVFTGWTHANQDHSEEWRFYWPEQDWRNAMQVWPEHHSSSSKLLLNGVTLPAGQTAQTDIAMALDNIFQHPNVGPFLCRQLIQRLVTSNPSPAYVYRCGQAFANNGQGVRGDLKAVVRSILLDWEARSPDVLGQPGYGKVREPVLRFVAMLRALKAQAPADGRIRYYWQSSAEWGLNQSPLQAPTVFNFFDPAYAQPGPIAEGGLVSPELQIINETSVFGSTNFLHPVIFEGYTDDDSNVVLNYSYFTGAGSDSVLLDRVNLIFYAGQLSAETRAIFAEALADSDFPDDPQERVSTLLWLVSLSPEFMGQR